MKKAAAEIEKLSKYAIQMREERMQKGKQLY